jgi:hypothetical protein
MGRRTRRIINKKTLKLTKKAGEKGEYNTSG